MRQWVRWVKRAASGGRFESGKGHEAEGGLLAIDRQISSGSAVNSAQDKIVLGYPI